MYNYFANSLRQDAPRVAIGAIFTECNHFGGAVAGMLKVLRAALPVDGVLLPPHGAAAVLDCSARSGSPPRIVPAQRSAWLRIRSWDSASSPGAGLLASQSVTIVRSKLATLVLSARAARSSASFSAASTRQL